MATLRQPFIRFETLEMKFVLSPVRRVASLDSLKGHIRAAIQSLRALPFRFNELLK